MRRWKGSARFRVGPSPLERARERIGTPEDVLRRHGLSVRRGMAKCALHEDRKPSLSVFKGRDGKQRWFCHGCQQGGDAIDLEAALSGRSLKDIINGS